MLDQKRENELLELCRELVKIPSLSGQEEGVAKTVKAAMERLSFDKVMIDKYGSVIGSIKGKGQGKRVLLDGHIDTVEVTGRELWKHDPFGAEIEDGKIYGRGTSDMKGAVASMITAAAYFAKDTERNFDGEIYVSCSVHEECFEGIASREISASVKPDYVIIGEASSLNLKRGQRGRAEIIVETKGKTAHSSSPEVGKSAVYDMAKVIEGLKNINPAEHPVLGKGIMELTDIISTPYPGASVVPGLCKVTYDRRTLVGETKETVLNIVKEELKKIKELHPDIEAKAYYSKGQDKCWTGGTIEAERFFPAWLYDEDHEIVQKSLAGLRKIGLNPSLSHYSFCTNGSHFAGEAGIPTVGFGPSFEHLAHIVDEWILVDQLYQGCKGYYGIIGALLG